MAGILQMVIRNGIAGSMNRPRPCTIEQCNNLRTQLLQDNFFDREHQPEELEPRMRPGKVLFSDLVVLMAQVMRVLMRPGPLTTEEEAERIRDLHLEATAMLSTQSRLVWALQVDVSALATHLDAEMLHKPVVDMLRCCNRYGTGEKAYITTLPVELVDNIAGFLAIHKAAERDVQRMKARSMYRCYVNECTPLDHLSATAKASLLCSMTNKSSENIIAANYTLQGVKGLMEHGRNAREFAGWEEEHTDRRRRWQILVGEPNTSLSSHGLSGRYRNFMRVNYGLEMFVAHKQLGSCEYDTLAYLVLPSARSLSHSNYSFRNDADVDDLDSDDDNVERSEVRPGCARHTPSCSGEDVVIHSVVVPPPLTPKQQERFARIEKLLDLPNEKMIVDRACTSDAITGKHGGQFLRRSLQLTMITRLRR
ncbi:hypothetical protein LTS10_010274 [Elasticomyces elasticus]|nr:hypothetical protein LTS10_010274 [Elasticomyces elasticus]